MDRIKTKNRKVRDHSRERERQRETLMSKVRNSKKKRDFPEKTEHKHEPVRSKEETVGESNVVEESN